MKLECLFYSFIIEKDIDYLDYQEEELSTGIQRGQTIYPFYRRITQKPAVLPAAIKFSISIFFWKQITKKILKFDYKI